MAEKNQELDKIIREMTTAEFHLTESEVDDLISLGELIGEWKTALEEVSDSLSSEEESLTASVKSIMKDVKAKIDLRESEPEKKEPEKA